MKTLTDKKLYQEAELQGATALTVETETAPKRTGRMRYLSVDRIMDNTSLRLYGDIDTFKQSKKYKALKEAIKAEGIITPLTVKKNGRRGHYKIIDGQSRLFIAQELNISQVPVIFYDESMNKAEIIRIMANSHQKQPTPIELGIAYQKLIKSGVYRNNRELAKALGISEGNVGARINNLKLDKRIIRNLLTGKGINDQKILKAIRSIETINDDGVSAKQHETYRHILRHNLSRKDALEYISLQKDIDEVRDFIKIMGDKLKVTIDTKDLSDEEKNRITTLLKEIESIKNGHSERAAD